jgi:nitroreductase
MPELFETMESCRAMRRLKPDPVPDELIEKILHAGTCAPSGGNAQKWRFLVLKDRKTKDAVTVWYKKAYDEIIGPRYASVAPPPGVSPEKFKRQHSAVEYLTDHFAEAPVWIVACLDTGPSHNAAAGASIYPAVQNRKRSTGRSACPRACTPTPSFRSAGRWASSARSSARRFPTSSTRSAGASPTGPPD